jgi:hypothetical protein
MNGEKPERIKNVLSKVCESLQQGNYIFTRHALDRQKRRCITLPETIHVLKTGYEEKAKTIFENNVWK